jgi:hypothetical protein
VLHALLVMYDLGPGLQSIETDPKTIA